VSAHVQEIDRAQRLLEAAGAANTPHPTGTLLTHLQATHDRLQRWGCALHLCTAGLCHSVYGTEGFGTAMLSFGDRERVREHVGRDAEELIHLYCVMKRASLYANLGRPGPYHVVHRITGSPVPIRDAEQLAELLTLDVANALEQAPGTSLWRMEVARRRREKAMPYLPATAREDLRVAHPRRAYTLIAADALYRAARRIVRRVRGERELTVGRIGRIARRWYRHATKGVTNPFTSAAAAHRYAAGRPDYHDEVVRQVAAFLGDKVPVPRAVDVGCGTGQSTRAMARLARRIVGLDASESMLRQAQVGADHPIAVARAERLPLADGTVDMILASTAFHWFDQPRFLDEARRVARPGAWLVVYDNGFSGVVEGADAVLRWHRESWFSRFPALPQHAAFSPRLAARAGFDLACEKRYVNRVSMDAADLARFLVTQSNVIVAIEAGKGSADEIAERLQSEIEPLFRADGGPGVRTCLFGGPLWIARLRA
jgi:SAM-dependent methyltransferase